MKIIIRLPVRRNVFCAVMVFFLSFQSLFPAAFIRGGGAPATSFANSPPPARNGNFNRRGSAVIPGRTGFFIGSPAFVGLNANLIPNPVTARYPALQGVGTVVTRSARIARFSPSLVPAGAGFVPGLVTANWPRGALRNSFWNQTAIANSLSNLALFTDSINTFAVTYPMRPFALPGNYFATHPIVYFAQNGPIALAETQARAVRNRLTNGGIIVFNNGWRTSQCATNIATIERLFPGFNLTALPASHPLNPGYFAIQLKPGQLYYDGIKQSAFTLVVETGASSEDGVSSVPISSYFGPDGQVVIMAN